MPVQSPRKVFNVSGCFAMISGGWSLVAPYLQLVKFHYQISYLSVIFGALIFSRSPSMDLVRSLVFLYLFFNVLLYGGIYTFNDIADVNCDRLHPLKARRPLPSGKVSTRAALVFAVVLIVAGFSGALWYFGAGFGWIFAAFLAINAVYSLGARDIPVVDLAVNSLTHPLRFMMGVSLTGREAPWIHLAVMFAVALGLVSLRRLIEMGGRGWRARSTLSHYSRGQLIAVQFAALACILALFAGNGRASWGFFLAVIPTYLVLIFGALFSDRVRSLLGAIWTR